MRYTWLPETAGPEETRQAELESAAARIRVRAKRRIFRALGVQAAGVYPLAPLLRVAIAVELKGGLG